MRAGFAEWQPSPNFYPGGMAAQPMGVVLHIEQGYESGTVASFEQSSFQASAHFGVGKDGHIDQFVDTADAAWAEAAGNGSWISIEHEGFSGDALTPPQIASTARIVAWLKGREDGPRYMFPLQLTDSPGVPGVGWHGMGGVAWGDHLECPGSPVLAQRPQLIAAVTALLVPAAPPGPPAPPPQPIVLLGETMRLLPVTVRTDNLGNGWVDVNLGGSVVAGGPFVTACAPGTVPAHPDGDRYDHAHAETTVGAPAGSQRVQVTDGFAGGAYAVYLPVTP